MLRCPNCSSELTDEYCAHCGQHRVQVDELSARHFVSEVVDEVTSFRTKFKTLRTLRGLLIPGFLTEEYLAGRRQPFLSPFKAYLVCAAFFFLSAPVAGFTLASMLDADRSGELRRLVTVREAERHLDPAVFNLRFDSRVQSVYTITLGAVAIGFALVLQVLFRKQRWPYGAHLVFALHYISFIYLVTVLAGFSRRMGASTDVSVLGGYMLILPYLILSLKRVYAESNGAIVLKGTVILFLTLVLNNVASSVAIRVTLALM
jgi:hypothetical protein